MLNAGLPGSDTCQQVGVLKRLLRELSFQSVVLGFYVNDVACLAARPPFALDAARSARLREPLKAILNRIETIAFDLKTQTGSEA